MLQSSFIFTQAWNREKTVLDAPWAQLLERMPLSFISFDQLDEMKVQIWDHMKDLTSSYKKTMQKTKITNLNIQLIIYEV